MAGLSISPNHRPRILPGCPTRGNRPGHRDRWRRLDVLASEPFGCICVGAVVLIADHLHDPSVRGGIVECRSPGLGLTIGLTTVGFIGSG
jgi:hypothetical protein